MSAKSFLGGEGASLDPKLEEWETAYESMLDALFLGTDGEPPDDAALQAAEHQLALESLDSSYRPATLADRELLAHQEEVEQTLDLLRAAAQHITTHTPRIRPSAQDLQYRRVQHASPGYVNLNLLTPPRHRFFHGVRIDGLPERKVWSEHRTVGVLLPRVIEDPNASEPSGLVALAADDLQGLCTPVNHFGAPPLWRGYELCIPFDRFVPLGELAVDHERIREQVRALLPA